MQEAGGDQEQVNHRQRILDLINRRQGPPARGPQRQDRNMQRNNGGADAAAKAAESVGLFIWDCKGFSDCSRDVFPLMFPVRWNVNIVDLAYQYSGQESEMDLKLKQLKKAQEKTQSDFEKIVNKHNTERDAQSQKYQR